jgi:hypothetical protein
VAFKLLHIKFNSLKFPETFSNNLKANLAATLKIITANFKGTIVQIPRFKEMQQICVPVFAQLLAFGWWWITHLKLGSKDWVNRCRYF